MTPGRTDVIATELKKLDQELNLSDAQREQLKTQLSDRQASLQDFIRQNPNASRKELIQKIVSLRGSMRDEAVKFLTPLQLRTWDSALSNAREFLGHSISSL
jgi:periplasmic protein CpxP/Spy